MHCGNTAIRRRFGELYTPNIFELELYLMTIMEAIPSANYMFC